MKLEWLGTCINWMDQLDGKMLHRDTFENNIVITTRTAERCTFVLVIHTVEPLLNGVRGSLVSSQRIVCAGRNRRSR
jgi:hypothetical protein